IAFRPPRVTPVSGRSRSMKPMSSDGETDQDKLEATKMKLQERYQLAKGFFPGFQSVSDSGSKGARGSSGIGLDL
ncbi:hypothetical protein M8C21_022239, partial [Ambrosia artemisiifolia]